MAPNPPAAPTPTPPPSYTKATTPPDQQRLVSLERKPTDELPLPVETRGDLIEGPHDFPRFKRQASYRVLPQNRFWKLVDDWWMWELLSWTFALLCMGAVAILLAVYDGRALPNWPMGFTINAYVSILGAFVKAALLLPTAEALGQLKWNWYVRGSRDLQDFQVFDEASRGPWGSFLLILRTKGR